MVTAHFKANLYRLKKALGLIITLFPSFCFALSGPVLRAQVQPESLIENRQLEGRLTLLTPPSAVIADDSFVMEGKPLKAELVTREEAGKALNPLPQGLKADDLVSVYRFSVAGQPQGLHLLPSISVQVDGKRIQSASSSYEITASQASPTLQLETTFLPNRPLYPGQRADAVVKILYNRDTDLSDEYFPILDATGLIKVGPKELNEGVQGDFTVQEIRQTIQADQPGQYTFPSSVVEGFAYSIDLFGKKDYQKPRLRAEAPPVDLTIRPFPDPIPNGFNGILGEFSLTTRIATPSDSKQITMGEPIELQLVIQGKGEWQTVKMPDIACQPGFSGFFQFSQEEVDERQEGDQRVYSLQLRPLSASLKEIPQVILHFFDPQTGEYRTATAPPLPLNILPISVKNLHLGVGSRGLLAYEETPAAPQSNGDWKALGLGQKGLAIDTVYPLSSADLAGEGRWGMRTLWIALVLGGIVLSLQAVAIRRRAKSSRYAEYLTSEQLMAKAIKERHDPSRFSHHLKQALLQALVEKGWIASTVTAYEQLTSDREEVRIVKTFLSELESKRYGGRDDFPTESIAKEAKLLYRRIRHGS